MADIKNPKILWLKAGLFLAIGLTASTLILLEMRSFLILVYLVLAIWAFCRLYYFAFYVIEHYADSGYRFSGIFSFLRYMFEKLRRR